MQKHDVLEAIEIARRVTGRELAVRLGLVRRVNTLTKKTNQEMDVNTRDPFMAGLVDVKKLHEIKAMGALLNPLYQNDDRMIAAGLFATEVQYDEANEELLDRMSRYYEKTTKRSKTKGGDDNVDLVNKWSKQSAFLDEEETPLGKAKKELAKYRRYMDAKYLPEMEPERVLGAFDDNDGDPVEPIYAFGRVLNKRKDLPSGKNLGDYVDGSGHFDFVKYLSDHKKRFPACFHVGVGQISPHISTEVDCESLFSQAGFLADSRRSRSDIRFYERLVVMAHRLKRIYCDPLLVRDTYMERYKNKDWDEAEERDTRDFLDLEKEIYNNQFPHLMDLFEEEDDEEEMKSDDSNNKGKEKIVDVDVDMEGGEETSEGGDDNKGNSGGDSDGDSDENSDGDSDGISMVDSDE